MFKGQGGGETHECPTCGEELPTEEELRRHLDESHGEGEAKPTVRAGELVASATQPRMIRIGGPQVGLRPTSHPVGRGRTVSRSVRPRVARFRPGLG
jgi:hypothetical protein